jgi:signal transduction histidine kinase
VRPFHAYRVVMGVRRVLRRHGDTLIALSFTTLLLVELGAAGHGRQPIVILLALAATFPVAARRRFPLAVFLLVWSGVYGLAWIVPGFIDVTFGYALVLMFAVFTVGAQVSRRRVWLAVVAICLCIALLVALTPEPIEFGDIVLIVIFIGTPWGFGTAVRLHRERKEADAVNTARLLAEETARGAQVLEAERAQIARELHDVVSHAMAVTLMQARGGRAVQPTNPEAALAAFDAIEHTNAQAIGDMRRMLNVLREADAEPSPSTPLPGLDRLPQLMDQVRSAGIDLELTLDGDLNEVPPGISISGYRIVQEALTNVLKHAAPAKATVAVRCGAELLELDVTDTGNRRAQGDHVGGGHGLQGIQERVAAFGGTVHAGPTTPTGYTVQVRLPFQTTA